MDSINYTQEQYSEDVDKCINFLQNCYPYNHFDMIVSVAMGGVYLGEALNHYLHLPHYFIKAKSYVGQQRGELSVAIPEGVHNCGTKLLLVDDIADSGHTLDAILKKLPSKQVQIITLFYKPRSIVKPDYYAREIANDSWINFFWEKETTKESMNVQSL